MRLQAAPHYIIVRCSKKEQQDRKEKIGSIYIPPSQTYMKYNLEWGEIISIGKKAHQEFPEMKVGDIAIMHHFVQGADDADAKKHHLIGEDKTYKYYTVTTKDTHSDSMSRANELYGIYNGEIIPHKDYIFLKEEKENIEDFCSQDEQIDKRIEKTSGGLFVFKEWKETAENITDKMNEIKRQNQELGKSTKNLGQVQAQQARNEEEMEKMSKKLNAITYLPYTVEHAHPIVSKWFNQPINKGQEIFMQNNACKTIVTFKDKSFIAAKSKYIGFIRG